MKFNYNDVLIKKQNKGKYNYGINDDSEIIEKYKKGEYRIVTEQARYPLANLSTIFQSYNLKPDYQRRRVWDKKRKSKLIESFIINVPIPPVFLYEFDFSKYEVMDGLQRITAILEFFRGEYKLEGLDIWSEINGKDYNELPLELKSAINRRYLSAIILLKETAETPSKEKMMKRFVFERLNTGGIALSQQEVRNALYTSNFNRKVIELAESESFRKLWGVIEDDSFSRMEDCELVLRFFAYKSACKHSISKSTRDILDNYAESAMNFTTEAINILEKLFNDTIRIVDHLFGDTAFKSQKESKKSEKMIYDAIMLSCAELMEEGYSEKLYSISKDAVIDMKFQCISENDKTIFNGKYTSIKYVIQRVSLLKKEIRGLINA